MCKQNKMGRVGLARRRMESDGSTLDTSILTGFPSLDRMMTAARRLSAEGCKLLRSKTSCLSPSG